MAINIIEDYNRRVKNTDTLFSAILVIFVIIIGLII